MSTEVDNNKRLAKNTLLLYLRMVLMTLISLYTSRVVLQALGVDNLGIYNVVGGVVGLMGIINGAMAVSTQRYLSFGLGQGDMKRLAEVFTTCFTIYGVLSAMLFVLAETLGLWIVNTQLVIPEGRMFAANVVYQFSIITCVLQLLIRPYSSAIVAHEKMSIYAYLSIIDVALQLGIAYLVMVSPIDVLITYGGLLALASLWSSFFNWYYCIKKFPECKIIRYFDKAKFKEMLSYAGWCLFGSMSGVLRVQGITVVLNFFFSPAVNAAMGIAAQVNGKVGMFVTNFLVATGPQITKYYAQGNIDSMAKLVTRTSKFSLYLILVLGVPVILEAPYIINLWLGQLPEYVVEFTRLMIILAAVESMTSPIMTAVHATGNIKMYQTVVGSIMLLNVPISYLCLYFGGEPTSVVIVSIVISSICVLIRLWMMKRQIREFPVYTYLREAYLRPLLVLVISVIPPIALHVYLEQSFWTVCLVGVVSILSLALVAFAIGLSKGERDYLLDYVKTKFRNGKS